MYEYPLIFTRHFMRSNAIIQMAPRKILLQYSYSITLSLCSIIPMDVTIFDILLSLSSRSYPN